MTVGRIPSVEGGIQPTLLTAKGDLISATAASTVARLPVGSDAQILVADSTASTGLKWATASSGAMTLITRQSFSAVANTGTTFDGVFSSTYSSYVCMLEEVNGGANSDDLQMQFRYAGPTTQASTYYAQSYAVPFNTSTFVFNQQSSTSEATILAEIGDSTQPASGVIYFNRVGNSSQRPKFYGQSAAAGLWVTTFGGMNDTGRIYTGLLFKANTGNITGTIAVYGLAK